MGNIPAPHLSLITALKRLEAEVINDFTESYGDNSTALVAAVDDILAALAVAFETTETLVGNGDSVWEADDEEITETAHGLEVGDYVRINVDSGATGATSGYYYVKSVANANDFTVSETLDGATKAISADGVVDVFKVTNAPTGVRIAESMATNLSDFVSAGALVLVEALVSP